VDMNIQDNGNWYAVRLDGQITSTVIVTDNRANQTYSLAKGLDGKQHTIMVEKRTESFCGPIVTFLGFIVDGGAPVRKPNTPSGRRIEVWGDSITCGYGDLGTSTDCHFSADTENEDLAYPLVTGRAVSAAVSVVCWSGKGVVRNYGDANPTSVDPMPLYLPNNMGGDMNNKYNWSNVPNAVVINLGTNDYSTQPAPSYDVFSNGYFGMTNMVRQHYGKDVSIFTLCGPLIGDPCCSYIQNITKTLNSQGDSKVYYVDMQNILVYPQDYGCDWHPAVSGQQKMSDILVSALKSKLGW